MKAKQLTTTFERDNVRIIFTRHTDPDTEVPTAVEITVQHRKSSITTTSLWLDDIAAIMAEHGYAIRYDGHSGRHGWAMKPRQR